MTPDHSRKDFLCSEWYFVVVLMRVRLFRRARFVFWESEQVLLGFLVEEVHQLGLEAVLHGLVAAVDSVEVDVGRRVFPLAHNVAGRITDEKFSMMSKTYEDEQAQLKEEIQTLRQEIEVQERQIENLEQFIQRVRKYEDLDELTPYALRELVKAIYIEAPYKSSGKRHQGIRISYDLVGFIPVEELLKQETA